MGLIIVSFLAGVLTILAPCVLPLLPIILGASVEDSSDKFKPYIVIGSLLVSVILFSILLKATTLFLGIDPIVWKIISGSILILFGLVTLFGNTWKKVSGFFSLKFNSNLSKSSQKKGIVGDILVGAALGPVFTSCSPTYAIVLAIILPISFIVGIINLLAYALGLGVMLLLISIIGQKLILKLKWASNPNGIFKKSIGIIFILVGVAIISGFDKVIETKVLDSGYFDVTEIEQKILDKVELPDQ